MTVGDGVRGSGADFLEGVRVMNARPRGVGVSGGDGGRSLFLSREGGGWFRVGVDGDGGI